MPDRRSLGALALAAALAWGWLGNHPNAVGQGVLAAALVFALWRFARSHLGPAAGAWTVALWATLPAAAAGGRGHTADLAAALCFTVALTAWAARRADRGNQGTLVLGYAAAGLCPVAGGLPLLLALLLAGAATWALAPRPAGRKARRRLGWGLAWGLPLALAPGLLGVATLLVGGSGWPRVLAAAGLRAPLALVDPGAWLSLGALALPWLLLAPRGYRALADANSPFAPLLVAWAAAPALFATASGGALAAYPAVAILGASALAGAPLEASPALRRAGALGLAAGTVLVLLGLGVIPLPRVGLGPLGPGEVHRFFLPPALALVAAGAGAMGWARERPHRAALALVLGLAAATLWGLSRPALPVPPPVGEVRLGAFGADGVDGYYTSRGHKLSVVGPAARR